MKIYVLTDLEGTAGVARWEQTGADKPGYPQAVRLATDELRACVAGIQAAAPNAEIWVWDAHGCGSLDFERFPRGAKLLNNGPINAPAYLDASFDAVFFLGQHAKAGTPGGNLVHTYSGSIEYYKLNGVELGEFGCRAALAGSFGVSTVFVSGDDKMMAEAKVLIPGIYGAQVKTGLAPEVALHLAPLDACALIRAVAEEATVHAHEVPPFVLAGPPYRHEIRIGALRDALGYLERGYREVEPHILAKQADRLQDFLI